MDQLVSMRVFAAVADGRGFAAAARRLRLSAPTVTRAVAALEAHLGARLLHRTTRTVTVTEAGARYLAACKRLLGELADADAAAAGDHAEPRGTVAVSAPIHFGRLHVAPVLLAFMARYPAIAVRTRFTDRVVDLLDEELDLAVRIGDLSDSTLTAVRVGAERRMVCASPRYLRARGTPRQPRELSEHDAITFSAAPATAEWRFRGGVTVTPRPRMVVDTADMALAAAVAGLGVTRLLEYQVERDLAAGRLRVVLADAEPPPAPVHLVHRVGRHGAARVRALIDFALPRLRARRSGAAILGA